MAFAFVIFSIDFLSLLLPISFASAMLSGGSLIVYRGEGAHLGGGGGSGGCVDSGGIEGSRSSIS